MTEQGLHRPVITLPDHLTGPPPRRPLLFFPDVVSYLANRFLWVAGAWVPFACAALFFFAAAGLNLMIRRAAQSGSKDPVRLSDAFAGLTSIWQRLVILGAMSLDLFSVPLGGATALVPISASDLLQTGPMGLGIMRAMPAAGAMMVGLVLSYIPLPRHVGRKLVIATTVFGLAIVGLGLSGNFYLTLALLWLIGASNELGEFGSGATVALFGLVPAILIGGIGTVAVSLVWAVMFPHLRQRDQLVEPPPRWVLPVFLMGPVGVPIGGTAGAACIAEVTAMPHSQ